MQDFLSVKLVITHFYALIFQVKEKHFYKYTIEYICNIRLLHLLFQSFLMYKQSLIHHDIYYRHTVQITVTDIQFITEIEQLLSLLEILMAYSVTNHHLSGIQFS